MRVKKLFGPVLLAAVLFACNEGVGPAADLDEMPILSDTPNLVKWGFDAPPSFSVEGDAVTTGASGGDSPLLASSYVGGDGFEVGFWAVRGEASYIKINTIDYSAGYARTMPFLTFGVSQPVQRPDGSAIAVGDSVFISITIDPSNLQVSLAPHGLIFDESGSTRMRLWYSAALGDLNGDGVVNQADSFVESQLLLWYQADAESPWTPIEAEQSLRRDYFQVVLDHFSGYAVAW